MCAPIISCVDTPPVLELSEHVLDLVARAVECRVEGRRVFSVGSWRNTGGNPALDQRLTEPVRIIALVCQQACGSGKRIDHERRPLVVTHLAFAEQQNDRAPFTVAHGMKLGVQASFGAPDISGNSPFFWRLAAVRCALRCVASIITWSGSPALPTSSAKIRLNTPRRLQRMNRL
jgi:hypothetical protein